MRMRESEINGAFVIHLDGRFDAVSSYLVEKRLNEVIKSGTRRMVVDLGGVDYISSGGLRVLLSAAKKLDRLNGGIRLACVTGPVREVMEVTGFCQIFQMYDTPESAASDFAV